MDGGIGEALIAGSALAGGVGGLVGNNQSAQTAKDQAGLARVQANQTDTAYREDLMSTISNIRAIRASVRSAQIAQQGRRSRRGKSS